MSERTKGHAAPKVEGSALRVCTCDSSKNLLQLHSSPVVCYSQGLKSGGILEPIFNNKNLLTKILKNHEMPGMQVARL